MANIVKMKRSAVAAKVPTTSDLELGELAVNTYDGKLYLKKNNGSDSIVQVGASELPSQTGNGGKYLTTDGTSTSWATVSGGSSNINPAGPIIVESDFIESWMYNTNGYPNNSLLGGFYARTSNSSYPIEHMGGDVNHPGIVRFTSGNADMQLMYGFGGYSQSSSGLFQFIAGSDVDRFSIVVRRSTTGSQGFFGFMDNTQASPNNCIGVRLSSSTLYCRTANGGTATESTFTNGMAANTWVQIDVTRNGSSFEFRRNGTLVQTISTNIPTTNKMAFGVFINNSSTGNVDFDYIGMQTKALTRY